jgi:uncharacterized protein
MPSPRRPFRINVGFLVHEEVGYSREFPWSLERASLGEDLVLEGFQGAAQISRTPQGLLVQGQFSGDTVLECVRCLCEFHQRLDWVMTELYAFNRNSTTESGLLLPEDAHIDLEPLLREYALLEVPISPVHHVDCAGLCPVCGQDLNISECGHKRSYSAPSSFAGLDRLSR